MHWIEREKLITMTYKRNNDCKKKNTIKLNCKINQPGVEKYFKK